MDFKKVLTKSALTHAIYAVILLGIIVFTIFGDAGLYKLHSLYNTKRTLEYQIKENKAKIELIEKEKARLVNPEYLESVIRKELGYIKDGEVVYQITP